MRQALALYEDQPRAVRLHTRIRAFTCPFPALLEHVPERGALLEVGCGHGLFANAAALSRPGLTVLGVDPAGPKIEAAEATVGARPGIRFRRQMLDDVAENRFDAVAVLDVLYLVPRAEWPDFLRACRTRLVPGGRLLLKEVATRPRWKFWRCLAQETLSVKLLGITLGSAFAFASHEEMEALLRGAGFRLNAAMALDRGYLTPHVLYEAVAA